MGLLTGQPTTASVVAIEPVRYVAFPAGQYRALLAKQPSMRTALQQLIGRDLIAKLQQRGATA
jgi:CRP-like cAMP-binding protein